MPPGAVPPGAAGAAGVAGALSMIDREERDGSVMLQAITRLRKKKVPAKIAVMRDSTLAWPRTENSASVRPMPSPPPSLRWSRMTTIIAAVTPTWMISSTSRQSWRKPFTASISRALLASLSRLGDSQKVVGLEAGAAHQGTVDVVRRQQLGGIAAIHRAAIEQPHRGRLRRQAAQYLANMRVRCGHFRRGRGLAGTDRPDRLVGHHELGSRRARQAGSALARTMASVSPQSVRRSEWPTVTWLAPASRSISADTSPVQAPLALAWQF